MYHGGYDAQGDDLPAIVKREFVCPSCGYRRVTYRVPEWSRPRVPLWATRLAPLRLNPAMAEKFETIAEMWEKRHREKARFENYDEWKAYFAALKESEHEERP
jgi:hypothetical protein